MEQQEIDPKHLNMSEKLACARDFRDISHENLAHASKRGSELSDEFTRLEVQIATILFTLAGFFLDNFTSEKLVGFSPQSIGLMRLAFAFSLFFLIASLMAGLLHIKRKEKFWDEIVFQRNARFKKWDDVVRKKTSFEEGASFHSGVAVGNEGVVSSPLWSWVIQTIFLAIALLILFVLAMVFLFR